MRRSVAALWLPLLLVACAAPPASRQEVPPDPRYAEVAAALEARIRHEMADKRLSSVTIALVDDQAVVWARGFGETDRPATADTVLRVGSVSKLFTDIAVMQLVERGELDLDAPVSTYLPDFAPAGADAGTRGGITLRRLTGHQAGLMREPPVGNYFDDSGPSLAETVASLSGAPLVYPPGTRTKYSNAGIAVVGRVLERVTGEPFVAYLDRALLRPMGLDDSAFEPRAALADRTAQGTMWTPDGREFAAPTFELGMAPAGSLYTTVLDLGRFLGVLFGGGAPILQPATLEEMWTPQGGADAQGRGYGIGFRIDRIDGHRRVGHGGAIYGFATQLAALPDDKLGVIVVSTLDVSNSVVSRIADDALRRMLAVRTGAPAPEPELPHPIDADVRAARVGRYVAAEGAALAHLRLRGVRGDEGHDWFDLVARGDELMLARDGLLRLRALGGRWIVDDRHEYGDTLRPLDGGAIEVDGRRFEPVPSAPPQPCRPAFEDFVGEYGPDHDVLYVLEQAGRLRVRIEWFYEYPLDATEDPDRFRFPAHGLYDGEDVVFVRGADGRVVAVIAAGVRFPRREVGPDDGATFRIVPQEPVDVLRERAMAASPPEESGEFLEPDLVELQSLDPTIRYDIRYAGTNNFVGERFYELARAKLQRPAAEALVRAHHALRERGLGLLIHDAYRPWFVTKMFWDATPESEKQFVADPASGSRHNRGCAVDLTLYDLVTGKPVAMVSGYDEFSPRAYPDYPGGTSLQRWHRELLRRTMEAEGFAVYEWEWWHFDFHDWRRYPIENVPFENH